MPLLETRGRAIGDDQREVEILHGFIEADEQGLPALRHIRHMQPFRLVAVMGNCQTNRDAGVAYSAVAEPAST